ncbi:MAG TPA: peptidylprolyl isomerase [Caulobacteraceae bacterium]|nr:peptidylprolyl isomerase [Caulobacteraceae bacterium]
MRPVVLALAASVLAAAPALAQPSVSALTTPTPAPAAAPTVAIPPPGPGDWRSVDADNTLVIDTNKGRILVELYPLAAPATVAQIETLARQHFYDGQSFFRVIDGFMDQTGDPQNTGAGGSSLPNVKAEFTFRHAPGVGETDVTQIPDGEVGFIGALPVVSQPSAMATITVDGKLNGFGLFCAGAIGMARADAEDSGNSQFFLMRNDRFELNQKYTTFGRVVVGEDVVRAIKIGEPVEAPQDRMIAVQVLADMPAASRPNPRVLDTTSAYFKAEIDKIHKAQHDDFNPCAVAIPVTGG